MRRCPDPTLSTTTARGRALLILALGLRQVTALPAPQATETVPPTATSASASSSPTPGTDSSKNILPIFAILAVGVVVTFTLLLYIMRTRVLAFWSKHIARRANENVAGQTTEMTQTRPTPSGISEADRPVSQRRRRRRRRRSAESIIVPEYVQELPNDEMLLYKAEDRPSMDFADDQRSDDDYSSDEGSSRRRPSFDPPDGRPSVDSTITLPASFVGNRSRSASDAPLIDGRPRGFSDPDRIRDAVPIVLTPAASSSVLSVPSAYQSPFRGGETLSAGRSRASTLRSVFTRSMGSSIDLPLGHGASPYGQTSASRSTSHLASASNISVASISAPLPNSLVASNYVWPKSGLTPDQVAFISSHDTLARFGQGPGVVAPPEFSGESEQADEIVTADTPQRRSAIPLRIQTEVATPTEANVPASPAPTYRSSLSPQTQQPPEIITVAATPTLPTHESPVLPIRSESNDL